MSRGVNKVILIGNLGRDAETSRVGAEEVAVTNFSVATTRRFKAKGSDEWKDETEWTRVVLWRNDGVLPYLLKGAQVYVEGRLQTRSYEKDGDKKYVTEVIADNITLLGGKSEGHPTAPANAPPPSQEDIPF